MGCGSGVGVQGLRVEVWDSGFGFGVSGLGGLWFGSGTSGLVVRILVWGFRVWVSE